MATFEEIYVIKPNGNGLNRLTNSGGARISNVAPDWNPAGTRIAYQRSTGNGDDTVRIIRPNGHQVSTLRDPDCRYGVGRPAWKPSGDGMAYVCSDGNQGTYIKTVDFATNARIQITSGDFDMDPEFSPTGDSIAYARQDPYEQVVIAHLDLNGQFDFEDVVAGGPNEAANAPDWAPTGDALVYSCVSLSPLGDADICTASSIPPHTESTLVASGLQEGGPAFSPAGGRFVYAAGPDEGDTELKVRSVISGPATTITSNQVIDQQPDWGTG